jgi:hypothetical protein
VNLTDELPPLLGNIPYLNGGLFDVHELEKPDRYGQDIQIPDKAFERVFDYFDQYQWHLDERPLRADNEINPDVLGYIFEKYINQKQMTEAARDLLNRELRTGVSTEKLVALVLSLHEEDRLSVPKDDATAREPKIIYSLGIRKD